jgi:hypothetical protein
LREPKYIGIHRVRRVKCPKWASGIRRPQSGDQIWLGSHDEPKKVVQTYDVSVYALNGTSTILNFPNLLNTYIHPISLEKRHIQEVAA